MPIRSRLIALLFLPAALALGACGERLTPPLSPGGDYAAVLVSPNPLEGSALIELTGPGILDVRRNSSYVTSSTIAGGRRVVIIRSSPGRLDFIVSIAPGGALPSARVLEVADDNNELRPSLNGYGVTYTLVKAP